MAKRKVKRAMTLTSGDHLLFKLLQEYKCLRYSDRLSGLWQIERPNLSNSYSKNRIKHILNREGYLTVEHAKKNGFIRITQKGRDVLSMLGDNRTYQRSHSVVEEDNKAALTGSIANELFLYDNAHIFGEAIAPLYGADIRDENYFLSPYEYYRLNNKKNSLSASLAQYHHKDYQLAIYNITGPKRGTAPLYWREGVEESMVDREFSIFKPRYALFISTDHKALTYIMDIQERTEIMMIRHRKRAYLESRTLTGPSKLYMNFRKMDFYRNIFYMPYVEETFVWRLDSFINPKTSQYRNAFYNILLNRYVLKSNNLTSESVQFINDSETLVLAGENIAVLFHFDGNIRALYKLLDLGFEGKDCYVFCFREDAQELAENIPENITILDIEMEQVVKALHTLRESTTSSSHG